MLGGPSSTGSLLLDQPFIFAIVWGYLKASDKQALRQGCKALRLAVDEQVASLALLDDDHLRHLRQRVDPSFFKAAGQRWPNMKRIALTRVADVHTLSSLGDHAPFPRLQAITVNLVGAWLTCAALCNRPLISTQLLAVGCKRRMHGMGRHDMYANCGACPRI